MKMNAKKRFLSWMIAFLMVFTYMPAAAYATDTVEADTETAVTETAVSEDTPAPAAAGTESNISVLDGQIEITNTAGTGSIENGVVTIIGPGTFKETPITNYVRVYNRSGKTATISFNYKAENCSSFSETLLEDSYTVVLDANMSVMLSITGKNAISNRDAVLTLSNFGIKTVSDISEVSFSYDETLGNVSVAGENTAPGTIKEVAYKAGVELNAVPVTDVKFAGWVNDGTGEIVSKEANFVFKPTEDVDLEAVFITNSTTTYYMAGEKYIFSDFAKAMEKATVLKDKTVVMLNDGELKKGTHTVPEGVTLLVPFNDEHTLYRNPGMNSDIGTNEPYVPPTAFCTLTLAEGANLVINGEVSLSARHHADVGGEGASGAPMGNVSFMNLNKNSTVTVNDGGALYAFGFVTGEGTVTAKDGSTIFETFQVEDFRGREAIKSIVIDNMSKGVLSLSQYYVQNIEVPMTIEAGATEYVYASFFMTTQPLGASVAFVSDKNAMFNLHEGNIVKTYDGESDRLIVKANGKIDLSSIVVDVQGQNLNSKDFDLPINSNISVILESGEVEINQDISLLPGAEITIGKDAVCTLAQDTNVYVYDLDQWGNFCGKNGSPLIPSIYAPSKTYERTEKDLTDAKILVNGTFDASKGFLYTTTDSDGKTGHANIYSTGNGVVKVVSGLEEKTYQFEQNGDAGSFVEIDLLPANLKQGDGSFIQTLDETAGTYTYVDGVWQCNHTAEEDVEKAASCLEDGLKHIKCNYGHEYDVVMPATGHTVVIDEGVKGTCTEDDITEGRHCSVCEEVLVEQIITPAPGHKEAVDEAVEVTCDEDGMTEGMHCSACKEVLVKQEVIPALEHEYKWTVTDEGTCTAPGLKDGKCEREDCGHTVTEEIIVPHKAHETEASDPTCTTDGNEAYWTCEVCDKMFEDETCDFELEKIPAVESRGHSLKKTAAVAATCIEGGNEAYWTCRICDVMFADAGGNTELKEIPVTPAKGHVTIKIEAVAATCTEAGNEAYWVCGTCDMMFADEACENKIDAAPVTDALGHKLVKMAAVAATCTETGNDEYWACGTCSRIFETNACDVEYDNIPVIKATGHNFVTHGKDVAATCTENGSITRECENGCGEAIVEVLNATGHSYEAAETAPTCTEEGYTTYTCTACGDSYVDNRVEPAGHTEGAAATCTKAQICTVCETELAAALGHVWEKTYTVDKTATTGRVGSKSKHCAVCDAVKSGSAVKIAKIKKTTASTLVYNGKKRVKNVTVVNFNGKKLVKGTDFTVTYKNAKGTKVVTPKVVGTYKAVVKFKGAYSGTVTKTFKINPKGTAIKKLAKPAKKQIKVTWKKQTVQTTGYQIRYSTKKNMSNAKKVLVAKKGTTVRTIKQLKAKKKYWVQIRTYKTVNGVKHFSAWSAKKSIKTK